jgi:hypothetical protein
MHHQKAGNLVRKDQARRLRYQEKQRIEQKIASAPNADRLAWQSNQPLTKGQLEGFARKLVK